MTKTAKGKHYSIAAHLIHSRIQLAPKRLDTQCKADTESFRLFNFAIINAAAEAVQREHGIVATDEDKRGAAELLLIAHKRERESSYYVLEKKEPTDPKPIRVTSKDGGKTIVAAGDLDRFQTMRGATAMLNAMHSHHPKIINSVRIVTRWEIVDW